MGDQSPIQSNGKPQQRAANGSAQDWMQDDKDEAGVRPAKRRANGRSVDSPAEYVKVSINKTYTDKDLVQKIQDGGQVGSGDGDEVKMIAIKEPFNCFVLPDFIDESESEAGFLQTLQDELLTLEYNRRDNDLNQFQQSVDLKSVESQNKCIQALRNLFLNQTRGIIERMLGDKHPLNSSHLDMSAARYQFTDYLLPHDDHLEGRRVAFIFYLVDSQWTAKDGGSLDLFESDSECRPQKIIRSIHPARNQLVFFEVTPKSWHQVAEVVSHEKVRVAVGGWFLKPSQDNLPDADWPVNVEKQPKLSSALETVSESLIRDWISPQLLNEEVSLGIGDQFEQSSEIRLNDFLVAEKYKHLLNALDSPDLKWTLSEPTNMRKYYTVNLYSPDYESINESLPVVIKEVIQVFQSDAIFLVLSNLTSLRLHKMIPPAKDDDNQDESTEVQDESAKECNPKCRIELRKWTTGCYSMCHDFAFETQEKSPALDVMLFLGPDCAKTDRESGGYVVYTDSKERFAEAKSETSSGSDEEGDEDEEDPDEPLLTIEPNENTLNLVYREEGTLRFMKYINHNGGDKIFYELSCVYYE